MTEGASRLVLVRRAHGGAVKGPSGMDPSLQDKSQWRAEEKRRIGEAAAPSLTRRVNHSGFRHDTQQIAKHLKKDRFESDHHRDQLAMELMGLKNVQLILLGG